MTNLEDVLKRHAMDETGRAELAPIAEILRDYHLTPLGSGVMARVYRIEGTPWVVKEGRWDPSVPLSKRLHIPLPGAALHAALQLFSSTFLPAEEMIRAHHTHYRNFATSFGFGHEESNLRAMQEAARLKLPDALPDLIRRFGLPEEEKLMKILKEDVVLSHNFLPKEHMLLGAALHPKGNGRKTSFLFQEYVHGPTLHDIPLKDLPEAERKALALFIALTFQVRDTHGILPDTRPRYPLLRPHDWLMRTDNVVVSPRGLTYVDTRWFWETGSLVLRRGGLIPELTTNSYRRTLGRLLETL